MATIGFHLYCKLLKRAVDSLKKQESPAFFETRLECTFDARLPDSYILETSLRLEIYHRLGEATNCTEVDANFDELKDRFGLPPPQALWLYHLTRLRVVASSKRYVLLKLHQYTLETEQLTTKGSVKRVIPFKGAKSPAELERVVAGLL